MSKLFYSLLIFIISCSSLHSFVPRGLLILLDDSENLGIALDAPNTGSLLTILYQNAGPVVVSASILANLFSDAHKDKNQKFLQALNFNPNQWHFKRIDDALYLLIPDQYLNLRSINVDSSSVKQKIMTQQISLTEQALGLKVNHMETVSFEDVKNIKSSGYQYATYFVDELQKNTIFCTRSDYRVSNALDKQPVWSIYMLGHGKKGQTIVGLQLNDFKTVLDYYEHKIQCRLLMLTACYAAGQNFEILFKDMKTSIQKTYPFAIITQAITDAPVMSIVPDIEAGKLTVFEDFPQFLKAVTTRDGIEYDKAVQHIFPLTPRKELKEPSAYEMIKEKISRRQAWANVPQIKLPGIEWFSVMASHKEIVSIGSILAKGRDPQKPLDIVKFFNTDPKALLLYAENIPFELIINSRNLEAIISMVPGDALHTIKKITSNRPMNDVLDWFMAIKMLDQRKIFYIKEVNTINNAIIYNNKIPGSGWAGTEDRYATYALYKKNNQLYVQEPGKQPESADTQTTQYNTLLQTALGKPVELGSFNFSNDRQIQARIGSINASSIIEKIESTELTVSDIIDGIRQNMGSDVFVWIKQMNAQYDTVRISVPALKSGDKVTLFDVMFKKTGPIYFTYNNKFYEGKQERTHDYKAQFRKSIGEKETGEVTTEQLKKIEAVVQKRIKQGLPQVQSVPSPSPAPVSSVDLQNKLKDLDRALQNLGRAIG